MTISLLIIARLILATVFVLAGSGKLADLSGSRQAMRDFGVPAGVADVFGVVLPLAELAIAVLLVSAVTALWGALGAMALLLIFVAGIGFNLAHGRTPDCHCFGQLHSAPAGSSTLIRNLVLAVIAGFVVAFGRKNAGAGPLELLGEMTVSHSIELMLLVVLLAFLIALAWLLLQTMRQQGRLLLRIEALETRLGIVGSQPAPPVTGLPVSSPAPTFELPSLNGETTKLESLRAGGKPLVLIFTDPACRPCTALLPEIAQWQREHAAKLQVALISRGSPEANRSKFAEAGVTHVLLQKDGEVAQAYQAHGTPSAVLIHQAGTIGTPLAEGADAIRALIANTVGSSGAAAQRPRPGLKVGEPAPDFSLPDLAGKTVRLSDFRGKPTLVLFWRPSCGFCARMLPDLKAWETRADNGAPKLLVVSSGTLPENKAMGLRSYVLLDQRGMSVASKFGAGGTPMAVLIDAEGRIGSELVAGAPAVLELATRG